MDNRLTQISQLKLYTDGIDKDLTMILQSLQWDRNQLLEGPETGSCTYDTNHRVLVNKRQEHETTCALRSEGYSTEDQLLADPADSNANTLVKLNSSDITKIIDHACKADPTFKKGVGCRGPQPLSLGRLQCVYTPDERRAIHGAVVAAVPSCHDLADLALLSSTGSNSERARAKSRVEILAELRDGRRRRARYRLPAHRNHSHELRALIDAQMEFYTDARTEANTSTTKSKDKTKDCDNSRRDDDGSRSHNEGNNRDTSEKDKRHDRQARERRHDDNDRRKSSRREERISRRDRTRDRSRNYNEDRPSRHTDAYDKYKAEESRTKGQYEKHKHSHSDEFYCYRRK